jgi:FkbM family methyltransferase
MSSRFSRIVSKEQRAQLRLLRVLGTLKFFASWLTPWTSTYRVRAARSKLDFFVYRRDAVGRHIAKYGSHESVVTQWLDEFLKAAPAGIVVDVGANAGWHSLHAAQHGNVKAVVAFEPDLVNASLMDRSLARNRIDKVILNVCAVGAARGVARLFRYKDSNFGRHSVLADYGYGSRTVPMVDLDGALADLGFQDAPILAIKIDVEGYEPAVIAGAARSIARAQAVVLEYSPDLSRAGGLSMDTLLAQLSGAGLAPFAMPYSGGTVRLALDDLRGLKGQIDLVWFREDGSTAAVLAAMKIKERDTLGGPITGESSRVRRI